MSLSLGPSSVSRQQGLVAGNVIIVITVSEHLYCAKIVIVGNVYLVC